MTFDFSHETYWGRSTRRPQAVHPKAAHEYQLLATVVACQNLTDHEVSKLSETDDDYAYRLYRSASGKAFVEWFSNQPVEFRNSFRLPEDIQTPPDGATPVEPTRPQIVEEPTPGDDFLEQWLQKDNSTKPTSDK